MKSNRKISGLDRIDEKEHKRETKETGSEQRDTEKIEERERE